MNGVTLKNIKLQIRELFLKSSIFFSLIDRFCKQVELSNELSACSKLIWIIKDKYNENIL